MWVCCTLQRPLFRSGRVFFKNLYSNFYKKGSLALVCAHPGDIEKISEEMPWTLWIWIISSYRTTMGLHLFIPSA